MTVSVPAPKEFGSRAIPSMCDPALRTGSSGAQLCLHKLTWSVGRFPALLDERRGSSNMMKRMRLTVIENGCACAFGTVDQTLSVMVNPPVT